MNQPASRPPRVRRSIRRFAIVSFAILLPVAAHRLWDYVEIRRLVHEVEAIRDRGEPVTARQAGYLADRIVGSGTAGDYFLAASFLAPGFEAQPNVDLWLADTTAKPSRDELAARLRRVVERTPEAFGLVDRALALEFNGFPLGTDTSDRAVRVASLAFLLSARSVSQSLEGEADRAVDSAIAEIRFSPIADMYAGSITIEASREIAGILSFAEPSAAALRRLQSALEEQEKRDRAMQGLLGERARWLDRIWNQWYGTTPLAPHALLLRRRSLEQTVLRPLFTHELVAALRVWGELIAAARGPSTDWIRVRDQLQRQYPNPVRVPAGTASAMRLPWWMYQADRGVAVDIFLHYTRPDPVVRARASRMAVAVERYRRDHNGSLPQSLSELRPAYVSAIALDPLSGQPLLYRVDADAYSIYSVGINLRDDGGNLRASYRGPVEEADIGVRVLRHP